MQKKAVLFDLDDTLYNFNRIEKIGLWSSHKKFCQKGKEIRYQEFIEIYNKCKSEIKSELTYLASSHNRVIYFQRTVETILGNTKPDLVLDLFNEYWLALFAVMHPFSETIPLMEEIKKRGLKTCLVSDHTADVQLKKIQRLGLAKYFDYVVTSEEAGKDKPDPQMFALALKKLSVKKDDAIMIGDVPAKDILGANAANIDSILFNTTDKPITHLNEEPTYTIRSLMEALDYL